MATEDGMSTEDLLRLFILKFVSDADIAAYKVGTFANGDFVSADTAKAINVDTTPT